VTNGLFTVQLDFGAGAFQGDARWLQIAVKCAGDASYTTLSPRQPLTPAPYALALPGLWTQQNATSPNIIGGYSGNYVTAGVYGATIGGGGAEDQPYPNKVTGNYGTIGGGGGNEAGGYATIGGGMWNAARGGYATVGGGRVNTASGYVATVGGGQGNTASGYVATVGGGESNVASGGTATIGGGQGNAASYSYATVGGGRNNTASGVEATVGGGYYNTASSVGATVGGGESNVASDWYATVGGGMGNTASGYAATVPGGRDNTAQGAYSFAAGRRAKANHDGAFVWADSTNADFTSTAANQFAVRATGGVSFSIGTSNFLVNGNTVWHAGNDGPGSGLDADTVDGLHANQLALRAYDGYVPAGQSVTIEIPHYTPFTLLLTSQATSYGGLAFVQGFENSYYVAITYIAYDGFSGLRRYGGGVCYEGDNTQILSFGSGTDIYTVQCPGEAVGPHNLTLRSVGTIGLIYTLIYSSLIY
jgi:hypothetical protein